MKNRKKKSTKIYFILMEKIIEKYILELHKPIREKTKR